MGHLHDYNCTQKTYRDFNFGLKIHLLCTYKNLATCIIWWRFLNVVRVHITRQKNVQTIYPLTWSKKHVKWYNLDQVLTASKMIDISSKKVEFLCMTSWCVDVCYEAAGDNMKWFYFQILTVTNRFWLLWRCTNTFTNASFKENKVYQQSL